MDLTDGQRRLAFAGIVVVLAGAGVYLTVPGLNGSDHHSAHPHHSVRPTATASSSPPEVTPSPGSSHYDIFSMLPFDKSQFNAAAGLAQRFVTAYGTYSYKQSQKSYDDKLASMASSSFAKQLGQNSGAGVAGQNAKKNHVVSTGSASVDSIRTYTKSSIIFVVTSHQQVSSKKGSSSSDEKYAVTVTQSGGSWQVYDLEPASAGNS